MKNLGNIKIEEIYLFGSRATGDFTKTSDYDILIIVKQKITIKEKMHISRTLRKELAKNGIDADVILKTNEEADYYKNKIGSVTKSALSDGVAI